MYRYGYIWHLNGRPCHSEVREHYCDSERPRVASVDVQRQRSLAGMPKGAVVVILWREAIRRVA